MRKAHVKEEQRGHMNRLRLRIAAVAIFLIFTSTAAFVIPGFPHQCTTTHAGDLILRGNETLVIEGITYCQRGDILVQDNAKVIIRNGTLVFSQSYHAEYDLEFSGNSVLEIDNGIIESKHDYPLHFTGNSTAIVTGTTSQIDLSSAQFFIADNSRLRLENCNVGHLDIAGSSLLAASRCYLNEVAIDLTNNAQGTLKLRRGHYNDWNLHTDNDLQDVPIDITLEDTDVGNWNPEVHGYATITCSNSEVFQLSVGDKANVTVENSTIGMPVIGFSTGRAIKIDGLGSGFIGDWHLTSLNSTSPISLCIRNSTIEYGWMIFSYGTPLTIKGSKITRLSLSGVYLQTTVITESDLGDLVLNGYYGTVDFDNSVVEDLWNSRNSISHIKGSVSFSQKQPFAEEGPWYNSSITREFPVLVQDGSGSPSPKTVLNLYSPDDTVIWTGITDAEGKAVFELIFDDNDYEAQWTLKAPSLEATVTVGLLTDTPILIQANSRP